MTDQEIKTAIINKVNECLALAKSKGYDIAPIPCLFNLKGRTAGKFFLRHKKYGCHFRFNLVAARLYLDKYLKRTVVHEVAHRIQYSSQFSHVPHCNNKPHGEIWKHCMEILEAKDISRCHSYELPSARRVEKFKYTCGCRTFELSIVRHKKIIRGASYFCKDCKNNLKPA